MNLKRIDSALLGAICLIVGWGGGTLLHECGHIAVARSFGHDVSMGALTLTTGSVFVHADLTDAQTALIAVAGSLVLIVAGVALVHFSANPAVRMIGVVFLCRAWIDALPLLDLDGGILAGSAGYLIAWPILLVEVLVCGAVIFNVIQPAPQTLYRTV